MALDTLTQDSIGPPFSLTDETSASTESNRSWRVRNLKGFPGTRELECFDSNMDDETGEALLYNFFALCDITRVREIKKEPPHSDIYLETLTQPSNLGTTFRVLQSKTQDQEDLMIPLRVAAEANDESLFVAVIQRLNWSQMPTTDLYDTIRLALKAGAHLTARNLATKGVHLHPNHLGLQKMYSLLSPPRVLNSNLPSTSSLKENRQWMQTCAAKYKGQWIALREGNLVANAPTANELKRQVKNVDGLFITKVL